eukprot:gene2438-3008_t
MSTTTTTTTTTSNSKTSKVPITLITGFLGSGKTTFLNYILNENHGKRIAVIQNEYGESIGIETAMVVGKDGSKVEEWLEFPNGCICCTVKDDFLQSIEDLIKNAKDRFDYILIESTGMGDPGQISSALWVDDELESPIYLDGIVTIVDAKHLDKHIEKSKQNTMTNVVEHSTSSGTSYSSEVERQICFADVILLNKIDLVQDPVQLNSIESRIHTINPLAKIIRSERSVVPLDLVLGIEAFDPDLDQIKTYLNQQQQQQQQVDHGDHKHEHQDEVNNCNQCSTNSGVHSKNINTICVQAKGNIDLREINRWVGELLWEEKKDQIFRIKGLISIQGESQKYILQGVYSTFEILPSGIEWTNDEPRNNKIVLIGELLDQLQIEQSLNNILIK